MRRKDTLGREGEELAAAHLIAQGLRVVARNWRCAIGELDIVAVEPDGTVAICEVKTRSSLKFGSPLEAVDHTKIGRIQRLAFVWAAEQPTRPRRLRFDVIEVLAVPGQPSVLTHHRGVI